jgi:hypothetical protein
MSERREPERPVSRDRPLSSEALSRDLGNPDVRRRMVEFLGGASLEDASCRYLAPAAPGSGNPFDPRPAADLWELLDERGEAARSLWDRRSLIVDLDVEHVHYDRPGELHGTLILEIADAGGTAATLAGAQRARAQLRRLASEISAVPDVGADRSAASG